RSYLSWAYKIRLEKSSPPLYLQGTLCNWGFVIEQAEMNLRVLRHHFSIDSSNSCHIKCAKNPMHIVLMVCIFSIWWFEVRENGCPLAWKGSDDVLNGARYSCVWYLSILCLYE